MPSIVTWDTDYVPESADTNPFNPRRNPRRQRCSDGPCLTHGERQTVQQIVQMHAASEKQSQNSHLGNLLLGSIYFRNHYKNTVWQNVLSSSINY